MPTVLLKLAGPLQSWGATSRFRIRETERAPTKSGVIGLVAAALGRARGESLDDLASLDFAVRIDQPGHLLRDYQTAIDWNATTKAEASPKLSTRLYLSDAVFVAGLSGEDEIINKIAAAIRRPEYPLFLGRRACPAPPDLLLGIREGGLREALAAEPWKASLAHQRKQPPQVSLAMFRDAHPGELGDRIRDVPINFSQERRQYSWREYLSDDSVTVTNSKGRGTQEFFFTEVANS
ncbi:type I-E CRISPR-associated protein Cas5/CasD [Leucobacter chinensis]|uniref:type I-E CRISPR-associated protein Cas5/CasD n=1 Tax=Leucobacter chinensis TaxID=2851010 RepID=UPI0020B7D289|nr:type I-E CRISPR-associated protein Cas5/CasD [Leucobacter chinensis]